MRMKKTMAVRKRNAEDTRSAWKAGCLAVQLVLGVMAAMAVLVWGRTFAAAEETAAVLDGSQRRIEQVYVNMPEVFVYGSGITPQEAQEAEGYLGQTRLTPAASRVFSETGEGIYYYVLLDVSGSIPNAYFQGICQGIQNLQDRLGEKDRLILCTFGESVILAADGTQDSAAMAGILAGLSNRDQKTLLFEGIDQAASLAEQVPASQCRRRILAVISDGEDIGVGGKQAQEAQATLQEKGLPVYALCIQDTSRETINAFGAFARTSGGDLISFSAKEGGEILCSLADRLEGDSCIEYQAETNLVSNQLESFQLRLKDGGVLTRTVFENRWIPDTEAPALVSSEPVGERQIRLTFSEPLDGLTELANYQLSMDGRPVEIVGITSDSSQSVQLSLAEPVENGSYQLTCAHISDRSMEKNPLAGSITLSITGAPQPEEQKEKAEPAPERNEALGMIGVLFLIFAAIVALTITVLKLGRDRKRNPPKKAGASAPFAIEAEIAMNKGERIQAVWNVKDRWIVGRSASCDAHYEDEELSRRHFCLEREENQIYVSDMHSTNGTWVNGVQVKERQRLEPGAVIKAGTSKFTVRW